MTTVVTNPLRDNVLVRLRPISEKTGSIIRVNHFEPSRWADVLATGPECRDTKVAMPVLVNPLIGAVIGDDLIMSETSVLAYHTAMQPARGLALVRKAETETTVAGGKIFLPESVRDGMANYQIEVLALGPTDLCRDYDNCTRPHGGVAYLPNDRSEKEWWPHLPDPNLVVGAWCVVRHRTFVPSDDPLGKTFFVRQADIEAVLSVTEASAEV